MSDILERGARIEAEARFLQDLVAEVERVIIGQRRLVERLIIGLLTDSHVLIEGVPGLAKTLVISTMAKALDLSFHRIQFTPDLLPSDVTGTQIYNPASGQFTVRQGPVFANLVLADEINRAPAKVQSALLEAMQERQVTIGEETHSVPRPFFVMATQNPLEQQGTYPLPEAQLDRFLLKIIVTYPARDDERRIVEQRARTAPPAQVRQVTSAAQLQRAIRLLDEVYIDERVTAYIVDLVRATRDPAAARLDDLKPLIETGASPRASIALALAARAHALLAGRAYVTPQDIKSMAHDVLRHRLILSYEAEAREVAAEDVITRVLDTIEVP
ncbi:MAG TPA: AAA family ATPase [Planctomycetota bacterium]|nr:AAA family ATPase [Planctomycetota bacterium]